MEFYTLYEFLVHSKNWTYVLMAVSLVLLLCFYRFLFGRDERTGRPD